MPTSRAARPRRRAPWAQARALVLAGAVTLLAGAPSPARGADPTHLLGDPGGARSRLEAAGLAIDAFWNHQMGLALRRGQAGDTAQSGSFDLFLRADLERHGLGPGATALLLVKSNYNRNVNDRVGALGDPVDDADFDEAAYVDQLWLERSFAGGRLRARLGYLDQQVAFDRNAYANAEDRQFSNAALDNSLIVPLEIGLGALLVAAPTGWLELALGVADADNPIRQTGFDTAFDGADGWTWNLELALRGSPLAGRPGTLRLGGFRDGAERPVLGRGRAERGHLGAYLSADQRVWSEAGDPAQGVGLFARAGFADRHVSRIEGFWSAGLQWDGPLPGRDTDGAGLAVYQTLPSDLLRERVEPDAARETGVELYYRAQLTPWLALTPDFQWIHQPGGRRDARDAAVFLLRVRVSL